MRMSSGTQPQQPAVLFSSLGPIHQPRGRIGFGHYVRVALLLLGITWQNPVSAQVPKSDPRFRINSNSGKVSAGFFEAGLVPEMRIEIPPAEYKKLQANNRAYVRCNIAETLT